MWCPIWKTGPAWGDFLLFALVAKVTNKLFRDFVEVPYWFQTEMMIAFELLHRFFPVRKLRSDDQLTVLDLRALGSPVLSVQLPVKVVGVDQCSGLEQLGLEWGFPNGLGLECRG